MSENLTKYLCVREHFDIFGKYDCTNYDSLEWRDKRNTQLYNSYKYNSYNYNSVILSVCSYIPQYFHKYILQWKYSIGIK